MSWRKCLLGLFLGLVVVYFGVLWLAGREHPQAATADAAGPALNQEQMLARGKYLSVLGNCMTCHTARGGAQYAGGRSLATPFGTFYTPNLTPDRQTGIGAWQADDFWRAMRDGKSKDGHLLYPVFPYQNYTRLARQDSDAIFTYLQSLPAVSQANRQHELAAPYRWQFSLALWRVLYFDVPVAPLAPASNQSLARGAYLVQGLGHCSACHTSRNSLGANDSLDLRGGQIPLQEWYAPSLHLAGKWSAQDLQTWLKSGQSSKKAAYGPMANIIYQSLQYANEADIAAISEYLLSLPRETKLAAENETKPPVALTSALEKGAKLYQQRCQDCHQADGKGVANVYPSLAGNASVSMAEPINALRLVLHGGFAPGTKANPRPYSMPPFGAQLSDEEVAAVLNYVRLQWGPPQAQEEAGSWVSSLQVARYRALPPE